MDPRFLGQRGGLCVIMSCHHELTVDQARAAVQLFLLPRPGVDALRELAAFRGQSRTCLYRPGDALFELADAMLCTAGPVQTSVELPLEPEVLRRHSSVYDALHHGGISADRLRQALAQLHHCEGHGGTIPGRAP
ncbi:hypothetical protein [Streptomyces sp. RPT161]|uniref:hypothetical protein n=1 Tax=Streptomyces sp. RPT161 TaxID=3015993 RepID=UPI0022B9345C|nr:hypothetical protein [Streptomyces sp. RPT161]